MAAQIPVEGCSTSPVNFNRFLWATSVVSLPSEKAMEANIENCIYILKNFLIRPILILVSFSLLGVHPQARRGGAGVVPHITDTENP